MLNTNTNTNTVNVTSSVNTFKNNKGERKMRKLNNSIGSLVCKTTVNTMYSTVVVAKEATVLREIKSFEEGMASIRRYHELQTEIVILRINFKKDHTVRRNISTMVCNYATFCFIADAISKIKEEIISSNSSSKGVATPKAPQNNEFAKWETLNALSEIRDKANKVFSKFSHSYISKINNKFSLERTWVETRIKALNAHNVVNALCKFYNKANDTISIYITDKKKERNFILINKNNKPRVDVDYNKITLGSFDVEVDSFVAENECCYHRLAKRFMATPENHANRSASVGINKNLGGNAMNNLQTNQEMKKEVMVLDNDFEDIEYSSVPVITGKEDSPQMMKRITQIFNDKKYAVSNVLTSVHPKVSKEGELVFDIASSEVDNIGAIKYFTPCQRKEVVEAIKADEYLNSRVRLYKTGPDERYRLFEPSSGLILVDFSKLNKEEYAVITEDIISKGLYLHANSDGDTIINIEKPVVSAPVALRYFRPYVWSPSTLKHCSMYFAEITKSKDVHYRMQEVDALAGGVIVSAIKKLQEKASKGETVTFADIAKIAVRMAQRAATPMVEFGSTGNILVIDKEICPVPEFAPEDNARIEKAGMKVGTNFSDGNLKISVSYVRKWFQIIFGTKLSYRQAKRISLQMRADTLCAKGYAKTYNKAQMLRQAKALCADYGKAVKLYNEELDKVYTGEEITKLLSISYEIGHVYTDKELALRKEKDMVIKALENIDLVGSKDEFKLINHDILSSKGKINICIINIFNPTESGHSSQQANKVADCYLSSYSQLAAAQAISDIYFKDQLPKGGLKLNNTMDGLRGDVVQNCMKLFATEDDYNDRAIATRNTRDMDKFIASKVGKMNSSGTSLYLALVPWDMYLSEKKHILKKRTVNHIDSFGKKCRVDALEAYSAEFNRQYKQLCKDILNDPNTSDERKAEILESLHTGVVIKYPTQGKKEFILLYMMTDKEMKERIGTMGFDEEHQKELLDYCLISSYSDILVACDNSMKIQIAGMDFDGDTCKIEIHIVCKDIYGNLVYGMYDIQNDRTLNDYVSMVVEIVHNEESVYSTACIMYDDDKKPKKYFSDVAMRVYKNENKAEAITSKGLKNYASIAENSETIIREVNNINKMKEAMTGNLFTLTCSIFKEAGAVEIVPEFLCGVKDILGLLAATATVGDNIGKTIKAGSSVINTLADVVWFDKDDNFNYAVAKHLFIPLKKAIDEVKESNKKRKYKEARKTARYTPVYAEGVNLIKATNLLGISRVYYRVGRKEVADFMNKLAMLPEDTTREEWDMLCADFDYIVRGLGESTIDVGKDITKNLGADMTKDIINSRFYCAGSMKPKDIKSNLNDLLTSNGTKDEEYTMSFGKFDLELQKEKENKYILNDKIGYIKFEIYNAAAKYMDSCIEITKRCNYKRYAKYSEISLTEYPVTTETIFTVLDYFGQVFIPGSDLPAPNTETRQTILSGLFNIAEIEGCDVRHLVKLIFRCALTKRVKVNGKEITKERSFRDLNLNEYIAPLNTAYLLFGDLMVQEYSGENMLVVELTPFTNKQKLPVGAELKFKNGVCINKEYELILMEKFTGKAIVGEDGIFTYFDAFKHIKVEKDIVLFSIKDIAVSGDTFTKYVVDETLETGFGITHLIEDSTGRLVKLADKTMALETLDEKAVCRFNDIALDKLDNKEIESSFIVGNPSNFLFIGKLSI